MTPKTVFGMAPEKGRWIFLLLGMAIDACLGAVYAYSVFKDPLVDLFGFSARQGNYPFMSFIAIFSVGTFFTGRFIDRYGPRAVMLVGSVLVGVGWMLAKFSTGLGGLLLSYSLVGGIGVGIVYGGPVAVAARWFPDKKGLAVGIALAGFGMSAFVTAPIAHYLIELPSVGVLNAFGIMGAGFLVICVLLSLPMRFPPRGWHPAGWLPPDDAAHPHQPSFSRRQMAKTPAFWALVACYLLGTSAGLMAIGVSAPVGKEVVHLDPAVAAMLVSIFAIFNGGGRPLFGWLADRIQPRRAAMLSFAIILLCSLGMLRVRPGQTLLYSVCFSGFWLCLGGWLAIAPATTASFFGMVGYAKKYGLVFLAYGLGAILGGLVSGMAKDAFGSYTAAFVPTAAMGALGFAIAWRWLDPPPLVPGR
jgi:MFS transporter, OFA family, oxalate/formate antiporter